MEKTNSVSLSVIVPVFNEEQAVAQVLEGLKRELNRTDLVCEIIVINDCSSDNTKEILEKIEGIKLINHSQNKGYGASLKTGIKNSSHEYVLFFDADGQHKPEYIAQFIKHLPEYDMVVGARTKGYGGPTMRIPGKKVLYALANYLTEQKIPDLNSGLRVIKKERIEKFLHLMPNTFSFSTTTTLLFLKEGLDTKFIPIEAVKRTGKSTVKIKDGFRMFMLILKTIVLFAPLRIFMPFCVFFFVFGGVLVIRDVLRHSISEITILSLFLAMLLFFFGILAEQLASIRKELH